MYFSSVIKMLCKASLPKCCMRWLKPINSWKLLNSVESYLVKMMIFYFPKIRQLWELYPWIFCLWSMLKIGVSVCLLLCCAWCGSLPGTDWVSQLTFSVFYAVARCLLCSCCLCVRQERGELCDGLCLNGSVPQGQLLYTPCSGACNLSQNFWWGRQATKPTSKIMKRGQNSLLGDNMGRFQGRQWPWFLRYLWCAGVV